MSSTADYESTEAYQRGVQQAKAARSLAPPPPDTADVTVPNRYGERDDRSYFKLCLTCGWGRGRGTAGRCHCTEAPT